MNVWRIPDAIYLYNEGIRDIKFQELKQFLLDNFGGFKIKIVNLKEKIVLTNGLIFNFVATNKNFAQICYSESKNACHIIITEKIFATVDEFKILHIRAGIFSYPSVISISGIVEGPAKPKEYYFYKEKYARFGIWELKKEEVKKIFKGKFIDYGDKRIIEVLKGYISQALFFYITGEPFCQKKNCRLFNSHWQKDLIYSQIKIGKFCEKHKKIIEKIKIDIK